ncbi:MAG: TPM domain-containing protein [Rhodothermales bacterium]
MRRCRAAVLVLIAFLLPLAAPLAFAQQVPPLTGRVVDRAEILSAGAERELEQLLAAHEDSTSNQIAVLTIRSLDGADLESYSLEVARAWELGQAGRDNGVLLLVAVEDRKMRIEVGYGLEGSLTDAVAGRIIRNELRPYFQQEDYEGGIRAGVIAIMDAIAGSYEGEDDVSEMPWFLRIVFGIMFVGMPLVISLTSAFGKGIGRWFVILFFAPFIGTGSVVLTSSPRIALVLLAIYIIGHIAFAIYIRRSPRWQAFSARWDRAEKNGGKVPIHVFGHTFHVTPSNFQSSGSGSSSSGGSSFSGGGGSFGGGGASGGW